MKNIVLLQVGIMIVGILDFWYVTRLNDSIDNKKIVENTVLYSILITT